MSCGVGHRYDSVLALLWLRCRLEAAALIRPIAWELPYAAGAALKRQKRREGRKEGRRKNVDKIMMITDIYPCSCQFYKKDFTFTTELCELLKSCQIPFNLKHIKKKKNEKKEKRKITNHIGICVCTKETTQLISNKHFQLCSYRTQV